MNISRVTTISLVLAVAVFALGYNTSFAGKPDNDGNHNHGDEDPPPPDNPIAYTAELVNPVFDETTGFGAFIVDFVVDDGSLITNRKQKSLLPDPVSALTFTRPIDPDAQDAWDRVFEACENFFGSHPVEGIGPTPMHVSQFTVPAVADNWEIAQTGGGGGVVAVGMVNIEFDINGISTVVSDKDVHFLIHLFFFGDTVFDSPKDPWLPVGSNSVRYDIVEVKIMGGTVPGATTKAGCVSEGSAPRTPLNDNKSTLVITVQQSE